MAQERRTLTVLFADLSGFTTLAEGRDPEEVQEIVSALLARLRGIVEREGGAVDKFIGDAVMALFGAERAHEDDPLRAARAGLTMQEALAAFNRERSLGLAMRVGINAGEALYGEMAGAAPTAMGDTVNVAQRLEAACRPGAVLVSRAVERATRRRVLYRMLDPVALKGRQETVQPFEAIGLAEYAEPYREAGAVTAPLVGRAAPLARLRELFDSGRPAFALVEGEAGIGKSRLGWEFRQELIDRPEEVRLAVGRCHDGSPLPLVPFAEMIRRRRLLEDFAQAPYDGTTRENYTHLMTLSIGVDVPEARVKHIEPARMLPETHHAWHMWVRERARGAPLVLVVEDAHWADEGTVGLLEYLAAHAKSERLMIVATMRPEKKPPAGFERIALGALDGEACRALARAALGREMTEELAGFLADESGANPYYLEELVRYLLEQGLIEGDPARLRPGQVKVPETLMGLLVGRIDDLAAGEKEAIKGASVIGRVFWLGVLEQALARQVKRDVDGLSRREMVFARPESALAKEAEYAFKHALLRDAAYSLLTKRDRARLHGELGRILEARGETTAKALAAAHWEAAGEAEKAKRLWREAAQEALDRSSFAEALEYARRGGATLLAGEALMGLARFDEALAAAADAPSEENARARLLEARVRERRGAFAQSLAAAEAAAAMQGCPRREGLEANVARALALFRLGRNDESEAAAEEALRHSRAEVEASPADRSARRLVAASINNIGLVHHLRGDYDCALVCLEESLAICREIGDRNGLASSFGNIALLHFYGGDYDRALACHEESLAIAREIGNRHGLAWSLMNIGDVHATRGDYERALTCYEESLAIQLETGNRHGAALSLNDIGRLHAHRGDYDRALACHEESLAIRREIDNRHGLALNFDSIGAVHVCRGDHDRALASYEESLAIRREIGDRWGESYVLLCLGWLHGETGRRDDAEAAFDASIAITRERNIRAPLAEALRYRARLRLAAGDERGRADAEEALALAREAKNPFDTAEALSTLARFEPDPARARALLDEARALVGPQGRLGTNLTLVEDDAAVRLRAGDAAGAAAAAREGAALARAKGARPAEQRLLLLLADAVGDTAEGREARDLASQLACRMQPGIDTGAASP